MILNKFYMTVVILLSVFVHLASYAEPFVVAIAGGSASGKTHVARKLVEYFGTERAVLYSMDNYYAPERQPTEFYSNGSINYDHPSAVDLVKLMQDLQKLKASAPVTVKEYTYGRKVEKDSFITTEPKQIIVLEGLYALYPILEDLTDLKVFVDVSADIRLKRRIERDTREGRSSLGGMEEYFHSVTEPMHQQHIQSTIHNANLVIDSPDDSSDLNERMSRLIGQIDQYTQFKSCERHLIYIRSF